MKSSMLSLVPVFPTTDIARDAQWYEQYTGFTKVFGDDMYCGLQRDHFELHLQWHADTDSDPLLGGSVMRLFVDDIYPIFEEFVARGTIKREKLRLKTDWNTNEFGFYDLNRNAIFIAQDL